MKDEKAASEDEYSKEVAFYDHNQSLLGARNRFTGSENPLGQYLKPCFSSLPRFPGATFIGVRKSVFLLAENDGGIHLTVKLTKNFLERFICYINDYILKNNF